MKQRYSGGKGFMGLKLAMSKTYDRVEWALIKIGFPSSFASLITKYLSAVTYSFMING